MCENCLEWHAKIALVMLLFGFVRQTTGEGKVDY